MPRQTRIFTAHQWCRMHRDHARSGLRPASVRDVSAI
jgi:hypothetical protein